MASNWFQSHIEEHNGTPTDSQVNLVGDILPIPAMTSVP